MFTSNTRQHILANSSATHWHSSWDTQIWSTQQRYSDNPIFIQSEHILKDFLNHSLKQVWRL